MNNFISIPFASLPQPDAYRLIISSIIPRPIALVSTISLEGTTNLAPFSFFNGVSSNPPCLSIAIARKPDGSKKDTLRNIEATGEFVVNSANEWLTEPLVQSAAEYPPEISEFVATGLPEIPSQQVKPPRVATAAFQYECVVYRLVEVGSGGAGSSTLVIGEIKVGHFQEQIFKDGRVLPTPLQPIARLGGLTYAKLGEMFDRKVPQLPSK